MWHTRGRTKLTKLGLGDNEVLLALALAVDEFLSEELLEALAHLALVQGRDVLDSLGSAGETVDGGELEEVVGGLGRLKVLVEVGGLQLRVVCHVEQAEAHCVDGKGARRKRSA